MFVGEGYAATPAASCDDEEQGNGVWLDAGDALDFAFGGFRTRIIGDLATRLARLVCMRFGEDNPGGLIAAAEGTAGGMTGIAGEGSGAGGGDIFGASGDDREAGDGAQGSGTGGSCDIDLDIGVGSEGVGSGPDGTGVRMSAGGDGGGDCGGVGSGGRGIDSGGSGLLGQSRSNQVPGMSAIGRSHVAVRMTPKPWS